VKYVLGHLTSTTSSWQSLPINIIRINHDPRIPIPSAYTWELIGICMALLIRFHLPVPILTDCQSIISKLTHLHLHQPTPDHHFLLSAIRNLLLINPSLPSWVKSHPERTHSVSQFQPSQWSIYLADAAASNPNQLHQYQQLSNPALQLIIHNFSLSDIISALQPYARWYWSSSSNITFTSSLHTSSAFVSLHQYLTCRSKIASTSWSDRSHFFGIQQCLPANLSISTRASCARIYWDKIWHGRNRAKAGLDASCPLCHAPDSLQHIIQQCPHPQQTHLRHSTLLQAHQYILQQSRPAIQHLLLQVLHLSIDHPSGYLIWLGQWTSELIQSLSLSAFPSSNISIVRRALIQMGGILFSGVRQLHSQLIILAPSDSYAIPGSISSTQSSSPIVHSHLSSSKQSRITAFFSVTSTISSVPNSSSTPLINPVVLSHLQHHPSTPTLSQTAIESFYVNQPRHPDMLFSSD
jgi:hypothetical protein